MYAKGCRYIVAFVCMGCPSIVPAGGLFLYELGTPSLPVGPQWRFVTGFEYLLCNGLVLNNGSHECLNYFGIDRNMNVAVYCND